MVYKILFTIDEELIPSLSDPEVLSVCLLGSRFSSIRTVAMGKNNQKLKYELNVTSSLLAAYRALKSDRVYLLK